MEGTKANADPEKPREMEKTADAGSSQQLSATTSLEDGIVLVDTGGRTTLAQPPDSPRTMNVSKARGVAIIVTLAGMNFLNTMGSGILIAALPRIASDINIPDALILWPAAVYALAAGCLLLLFGSVADIIGPKKVWVVGSVLFAIFTVATGFAQNSLQIILFRTLLGIAMAMCLPTSVSLITNTFPDGRWKNTAFAMSGMAQPLGYALGFVLGGIFTDTIGWRWSYYIMAMINICLSVVAAWSLPTIYHASQKKWHERLKEDVDWLGVAILAASLGMLMYILSNLTSDYRAIGSGKNIAMLVISLALLALFPFWMHFQVKRRRPALIPNHLWAKATFTSACVSVFFCWASLNSIEYFITLFFQKVQGLSALESSIRYFSQIVMGTSVNIVLVFLLPRVPVVVLTAASACLTIISPALMATVGITESYWLRPFWALLLCPINPWVLFSVSNLVISDAFPTELQSLAGSVFNEVAQFGNSVGLAVAATIAASVTEHSPDNGQAAEEERLMEGYRAAFWTIFASTAIVLVVSCWGFRGAGTIGKSEADAQPDSENDS